MVLRWIATVFSVLLGFLQVHAQQARLETEIHFKANPEQLFGFDAYSVGWEHEYPKFFVDDKAFHLAYKSLAFMQGDPVDFVVSSKLDIKSNQLKVEINNKEFPFKQVNDSLFSIDLPKSQSNFYVVVSCKNKKLAKLFVSVLKPKREKVILVPLIDADLNTFAAQEAINAIYRQANLKIDLLVKPKFKSKVFSDTTVFSIPDPEHKRYTGQMRLLRDVYFEANPSADRKANYIFLVKAFADSSLNGYMVRNKSFGLLTSNSDEDRFAVDLAQTLAYGLGKLNDSWLDGGPEKGTSQNLMDSIPGRDLRYFQWQDIQNSASNFSFYDQEEFVKTNNGTVAYYFWEEDKFGNILVNGDNFLEALKKPYKNNHLSYRFNVKYAFLMPFYKVGNYYINVLTLVFVVLILFLSYYLRKRLKSFWERKFIKRKFWRRLIYIPLIALNVYILLCSFDLSNFILDHFTVVSGPVPELGDQEYKLAKKDLFENKQLRHKEEYGLCSEILIHQHKKWQVKKRKKVLYFEWKKNTNGQFHLRFKSNSDSLILEKENYRMLASSHYFVISHLDSSGAIQKQDVYNYSGKNITQKLKDDDRPKRIVLFVNGYRPTSVGHTFEENFNDIQKNGLEFPNSKNVIYDFDRYDYWEQWNQINLLFQNRLNPNEVYYADGHFSVSTSNYKNILNFSNLSSQFPRRCSNPKKHTCYYWKAPSFKDKILNNTKTSSQLKFSSNKKGFQLRRKKGRLAGINLLQIINDVPNNTSNDTLFIVAHSMGYAYALGIVDQLRGKINFGGFYIIAAENAKAGSVNEEEWQEIWQYGINFNRKNPDAPCLQDGVAPQYKAGGLSDLKRVYFPQSLYTKKGFFDSHFIGNYTWILKIKEGKKGYIRQR